MKTLFLLISLAFLLSRSFAQTQLELNDIQRKNYVAADSELNLTYQRILTEYKDDTAFTKSLIASEKIWIKFRDAEMKMKYPDREPGYYGTIQPMCWSMYLTQLTLERTATLKQWLEGTEEGDVCAGSVKARE
jgi:uncharacterized protein YecT (DUF1311 family)